MALLATGADQKQMKSPLEALGHYKNAIPRAICLGIAYCQYLEGVDRC
jgi:hypothetical protein